MRIDTLDKNEILEVDILCKKNSKNMKELTLQTKFQNDDFLF